MKLDKLSKTIGFLLILGGLIIIGLIYLPILSEEIKYQSLRTQSRTELETEIMPVSEDFGLLIPKIGVNAEVFANINPYNPSEYLSVLSRGVAHAQGSAFPGETGNVFIFAHSADSPLNITRYNAVFYLINKLSLNDEIIIYYQGVKYSYRVVSKKIVPPELVEDLLVPLRGRTLTLQTCLPPGTTINRLLVVAEEVD